MARFTPQLRWKIAQAALLSSAGALDPLPVEEYIQASIIASIVAETSCDPIKCQIDLNFGQLYEPYIPFCVRDFTAKDCLNLFETAPGDNVVARLLAATKAQWKAAMIELAILQTVHRRHTAAEFRDEETFAAQDAYRDALVERLKQAQKQANECWGGVLEAIQTCEVSRPRIISARQQSAYLLNLDTHGFGQLEMKLLRAASIHPIDIHWASRVMNLVDLDIRDVPLTEALEGIMKINTFEDIYHCTCEHA
ncbi:MAG: hypothetical protein JJ939_10370 [Alphaproteobacteria bacterium]|nr:hypothetical protein [Alphaproteobacteria bacterium]MBO6628818.1 hypothetical protein [Alphaproteobacteria bacterium]MDF1627300.1 hypothetical protein [Parvibaculaceae bacterium]